MLTIDNIYVLLMFSPPSLPTAAKSVENHGFSGHPKCHPRIAADCCGAEMGKDGRNAERVTTTFTRAQKAELDRLAHKEGVKVAWLVRRAVERMLEEASGGPFLPLTFGDKDNAER